MTDQCSPASFVDSGYFSSSDSRSCLSSGRSTYSAARAAVAAESTNRTSMTLHGRHPATTGRMLTTPRCSPVPLRPSHSLSRMDSLVSRTQASKTAMMRYEPFWALASFTAEMVVWLWFETSAKAKGSKDPLAVLKDRVVPSERFVGFCHSVLATTQVSHSVVILALLYVARLKSQNEISGSPGSEYRLTVTALMMANKVLDDNTYTAKTWADVASLELQPLVAGESEFLRGLDWKLHTTEAEFDGWIKLLDGHVNARLAQLETLRSLRRSERLSRKVMPMMSMSSPFEASASMPSPLSHADSSRPVTRAFAAAQQMTDSQSRRHGKRPAQDDDTVNGRSQKRLAGQVWPAARAAPPTPSSFGSQSPADTRGMFDHAAFMVPSSSMHPAGLAAPISPYASLQAQYWSMQPVANAPLSYYSLAAGQRQGVKHYSLVPPVEQQQSQQQLQYGLPTPHYDLRSWQPRSTSPPQARSAPSFSPAASTMAPLPPFCAFYGAPSTTMSPASTWHSAYPAFAWTGPTFGYGATPSSHQPAPHQQQHQLFLHPHHLQHQHSQIVRTTP